MTAAEASRLLRAMGMPPSELLDDEPGIVMLTRDGVEWLLRRAPDDADKFEVRALLNRTDPLA